MRVKLRPLFNVTLFQLKGPRAGKMKRERKYGWRIRYWKLKDLSPSAFSILGMTYFPGPSLELLILKHGPHGNHFCYLVYYLILKSFPLWNSLSSPFIGFCPNFLKLRGKVPWLVSGCCQLGIIFLLETTLQITPMPESWRAGMNMSTWDAFGLSQMWSHSIGEASLESILSQVDTHHYMAAEQCLTFGIRSSYILSAVKLSSYVIFSPIIFWPSSDHTVVPPEIPSFCNKK